MTITKRQDGNVSKQRQTFNSSPLALVIIEQTTFISLTTIFLSTNIQIRIIFIMIYTAMF